MSATMPLVDKENEHVNIIKRMSNLKDQGPVKAVSTTSSHSSRFNSLLQDAYNKIRVETDNMVALDKQADEVCSIINEWIQENQDYEHAKELAKALEEEDSAAKKLKILRGESAALKVAVDEKRRMKRQQEEKKELEEADAAYAKQLLEMETAALEKQKHHLLEADAKFAAEYRSPVKATADRHGDDDGKAATDNQTTTIGGGNDSSSRQKTCQAAEAKFTSPVATKMKRNSLRALETPDDKQTPPPNHRRQPDGEQEEEEDEVEYKEEKEASGFNPHQEQADYLYSLRLMTLEERAAFMTQQEKKYHAARIIPTLATTADQEEQALAADIAQLWEEADAEVHDVPHGICLTILLPQLGKLAVYTAKKNKQTIVIEAERMVLSQSLIAAKASQESLHYLAEFYLEGSLFTLQAKDYSYEYRSETGLLFVFIENMNLDNKAKDNYSKEGSYNSNKVANSLSQGSGKGRVAGAATAGFLTKMKKGFMRIVGGGGNDSGSKKECK